ncbi:MAG: prolyl oligopeptidase family protein [Candidatus Thorarchaeota archaeon]
MGQKYPVTRRENIVDEIHGVKIEDPYRWLEDATSKEVLDWVEEQNKLTSSILEGYGGEDIVKKRLLDLFHYDYIQALNFWVVKTEKGPRFFYFYREAGKNQPSICYQDGEDGKRIVLYDPFWDSEEGLISADWFAPSSDGSYIAYGKSHGGTEQSTLYVKEVETKESLSEAIPQTKWCSIVWYKNEGFYYSRYPLPGTVSPEDENYYHHIYYHKLGDDYKNDVKVFGEGRPKTEHPIVTINEDHTLLAICSYRFISSDTHVARIDPGNPSDLNFVPLIENDQVNSMGEFYGNYFYVVTQISAPNGQITRYDMSEFKDAVPKLETIVKETDGVLTITPDIFAVFGDQIAVVEEKSAASRLKVYDIESGNLVKEVNFDSQVTVNNVSTAPGLDAFYYSYGGYFYPATHYTYSDGESKLFYKPKLDLDDDQFQTKLVWYTSKDGTKVSMFILSKKGMEVSEKTPVTLAGYGGFAISNTPIYSPAYVAWVERGGIVAVAHLRGGGEYGQKWHRAGNRENKQNVFDDFIAAAEWLIENKIGSRETIAILGGSNGGLLVGAALVQRPDLFKAVSCHVPLLDMVRYTNFQVAKTWATEYGDPEIKEEFEWIYPYSPYHHVKDVEYPATFLHTALGDTRVDSMHAFKMVSKLQNVAGEIDEKRPQILHTESQAGHGAGSSIDQTVAIWAKSFVFRAYHTSLDIK